MRMFLPIKGPGGRNLTPREKAALLILAVTLVFCALTLLEGVRAYRHVPAQNPVFAMVSLPSRTLGGGVVALYALVLTWCALLYFKGEQIARIQPVGGRLLAALGVTLGISGVLGLTHVDTAGHLGALVGNAVGHTVGSAVGLPLLLILVIVAFHLAAEGSWTAIREASPAPALPLPRVSPFLQPGATGQLRGAGHPPLPDDGDLSAEARTLAVTQAVEEIERRQGVTIVEMERPDRASIGEEVEEAAEPAEGSEEEEIRRGLQDVARSLGEGAPQEPPAASQADGDSGAAEETAGDDEAPAAQEPTAEDASGEDRGEDAGSHQRFDWRGRPLE